MTLHLAMAGAGHEGKFKEAMGIQIHLGAEVYQRAQGCSSVSSGPWDLFCSLWALGVGSLWYLHSH